MYFIECIIHVGGNLILANYHDYLGRSVYHLGNPVACGIDVNNLSVQRNGIAAGKENIGLAWPWLTGDERFDVTFLG